MGIKRFSEVEDDLNVVWGWALLRFKQKKKAIEWIQSREHHACIIKGGLGPY